MPRNLPKEFLSLFSVEIRVIVQLNGTFHRELVPYYFSSVVLLTISILFFQLVVHARRQCLNLNEE